MKKIYLMVFSNPLPGKEEEYNRWYSDIHLPEVIQLCGFIAAQRFTLTEAQVFKEQPYKYLAFYEVAEGKVASTIEMLFLNQGKMTMEPVIDLPNSKVSVFESITDVLLAMQ